MMCPVCNKKDAFMIDTPHKDIFPYVFVCVDCASCMKKMVWFCEKYNLFEKIDRFRKIVKKIRGIFT